MTDTTNNATAQGEQLTKEQKKSEVWAKLDALLNDNLDLAASDYLSRDDLDGSLDDVMDKLQDAVAESSEIIYYSRAMEYLSENDASLSRSLAIAAEMGYSLEDLNSEKLATLLNYEDTSAALYGIRDDIEEIIDERQEIDEEDEEDEEDAEGMSLADAGEIIAENLAKMHENL